MKKEAMLYEKAENDIAHCCLCSHHCNIPPSKYGICGVRKNISGSLYTLVYAKPCALHADPIEKKPLYHFLPGSTSLSIATVGCNFKCDFCQNWQISQASFEGREADVQEVAPEAIVKMAKKENCRSVSYTYTEPTVFFEYAYDIAALAKQAGLYNIFVTNGYMTKEALRAISPYLSAANVDLKSFSDGFYKMVCGARLAPVLDSIRLMKELGIWVEITTLVIPGRNDSDEELRGIAEFIAALAKEIPWHISRYHPDYQYKSSPPTPVNTLKKAMEIGKAAGLRYIYLGNVLEGNNTYCHKCGNLLIERIYFSVSNSLAKDGKCVKCGTQLDGVF